MNQVFKVGSAIVVGSLCSLKNSGCILRVGVSGLRLCALDLSHVLGIKLKVI